MKKNRIIKTRLNTTLLVIAIIAILSVFLPWAHGKGSISYSGGGLSGGGSARTAGVSGINFGSGFFAFIITALYGYFLWKKKTSPRILFVLLPWVIFITAISFIITMSNASSHASSSYGGYGGSASSRLEPDFGFLLFTLSALIILIISPFRTRKPLPGEVALENAEGYQVDSTLSNQQSDPLEAISKLKKMKDEGLITEEEFVKKKSELLERI